MKLGLAHWIGAEKDEMWEALNNESMEIKDIQYQLWQRLETRLRVSLNDSYYAQLEFSLTKGWYK